MSQRPHQPKRNPVRLLLDRESAVIDKPECPILLPKAYLRSMEADGQSRKVEEGLRGVPWTPLEPATAAIDG